jgi:hypothetical protein
VVAAVVVAVVEVVVAAAALEAEVRPENDWLKHYPNYQTIHKLYIIFSLFVYQLLLFLLHFFCPYISYLFHIEYEVFVFTIHR